jgi:hypothetical protein
MRGSALYQLALGRNQRPTLVNTVKYFRGSIKDTEFLGQLSNYQLLKNPVDTVGVTAEISSYCLIQSDELNAFKSKVRTILQVLVQFSSFIPRAPLTPGHTKRVSRMRSAVFRCADV